MDTAQSESQRAIRGNTWDSVVRGLGEVAVCEPVLDLAPRRKFHHELQKSMSFNKWRAVEEDHPLVRKVEDSTEVEKCPEVEKCDEGREKRVSSPSESQKAKLESLRAAVKSDLRRAIMKRTHSPDSAGAAVGAFMRKNFPSASQKLMSLEVQSQDLSAMTPSTIDSTGSWNDGLSDSFCGNGNDFSLDGLDWEDFDCDADGDDDGALMTPDSQSTTSCLKPAWSMQPLDTFSEGSESKKEMVKLMGNSSDQNDYRFYSHKSLGISGASFIAYSKISVPANLKTQKSSSTEMDQDEDQSLTCRVRNGILSAGKKVLSSVWTWAVVVVLCAGAKITTSYVAGIAHSEPPQKPTKYWIESNKLEFDWEDDVEFKFHNPTRN